MVWSALLTSGTQVTHRLQSVYSIVKGVTALSRVLQHCQGCYSIVKGVTASSRVLQHCQGCFGHSDVQMTWHHAVCMCKIVSQECMSEGTHPWCTILALTTRAQVCYIAIGFTAFMMSGVQTSCKRQILSARQRCNLLSLIYSSCIDL